MGSLSNTTDQWGWVSIGFHWVSFLAVIFLFAEGVYMVDLSYYDPLYHSLPQWHKLVGVGLALLTVSRLLWRLFNRSPALLESSAVQAMAAKAAHLSLYLLMVLLIVSGYVMTTADGKPIETFGIVIAPAITSFSDQWVNSLGALHRWLAYGLIGVVGVHSGAALFHHFVLKDKTLIRMLHSNH